MWYNDVATPAFVCITGMIFFVVVDTEMAKTIFSILKTFQMAAVRCREKSEPEISHA